MPLGSTGNVRLVCTDDCRSQQRLVAFANAVGKMSTTETFADSNVLGKPTSYSGFLLRFATEDLSAVEFFEKELGTIVMGRTKKVTFRSLPKLHRMVVHELAEEYNMVSESSGKEPNRHIVVSHRGAGFKPTAPRPLLSEAYFSKKKEAMNMHRSPLSKSLIIHVASLSRIHGSADITTRVERELKMHSGFFVVVRKETMKNSNLTGVLVRFSTRERMEMARTALSVKSGISVQSFDAVVGAAEASAVAAAPVAVSVVATPWSTSETSGAGPSRPEKTEPAPAPVQNVPDSWEDD